MKQSDEDRVSLYNIYIILYIAAIHLYTIKAKKFYASTRGKNCCARRAAVYRKTDDDDTKAKSSTNNMYRIVVYIYIHISMTPPPPPAYNISSSKVETTR